jgi:predicted metalloprotease
MRSYIRGIRDQLNTLGSVQVMQGVLDETTDTEVFLKLVHKRTVYTWGLNLQGLINTVIKPQFFYYSSITKQRKTSGCIPEEGIYVHSNGKAYVEIKFAAEFEDFDMVIFHLTGVHKGEYTISSEKVEQG